MSFYATYRPSKIAELDSESVRNQLLAILKSGTFSHAYLFTGPRGTGKTSTARIIAKTLNCEKNQLQPGEKKKSLNEPCNACTSCLSIAAGSSLAVVEIDAASNRGIDDIRTLKEQVILAPSGGAFCIYIIDEVHMLTTEAFNALLKTIEEPPDHALFILCTTEAQKVPATIHSRCTRIAFNRATTEEIQSSLQKAIAGENLQVDSQALHIIAENSDGSFRDGMKLLEQLSKHNKKISLDMANLLTGYTQEYAVDQLIEALLKKDCKAALAEVTLREQQGVDFALWSKRLIEALRDQLLMAISGSKKNSAGVYLNLITCFTEQMKHQRNTPVPQLPLEMAIISWCFGTNNQTDASPNPKAVARQASDIKSQYNETAAEKSFPAKLEESKEKVLSQDDITLKRVEEPARIENRTKSEYSLDLADVESKWPELLAMVRDKNVSVEALLKAARPATTQGNKLTLEVLYAFHKEQLEQQRHRSMVEAMMTSLFGGECQIQLVLTNANKRSSSGDQANVTGKLKDEQVAAAVDEIFG